MTISQAKARIEKGIKDYGSMDAWLAHMQKENPDLNVITQVFTAAEIQLKKTKS